MLTLLYFVASLPLVETVQDALSPRAPDESVVRGRLVHEDGAPLAQPPWSVYVRSAAPGAAVLGRGTGLDRRRFDVVVESLAAGQPFELVVEHAAYPTQVFRIDDWSREGRDVQLGELRMRDPLPRIELEGFDADGSPLRIVDAISCAGGRIVEGIHVHPTYRTPARSERDAAGRVYVTKRATRATWYVRAEDRAPALVVIDPEATSPQRVEFARPGWLLVEVPSCVAELAGAWLVAGPRGSAERARPEIASRLTEGRAWFAAVEAGVAYEISVEHDLLLGYRAVLGEVWAGAADDRTVQPLRARTTWHEFTARSSTGVALDATFELPDSPSPTVHGPRARLVALTPPNEVRVRAPGHRTIVVPVTDHRADVVLDPAPLARLHVRGARATDGVRFTVQAFAPERHPRRGEELALDPEGCCEFPVTDAGPWRFLVRAIPRPHGADESARAVELFATVAADAGDVVLDLPTDFAAPR